VANIKRGDAENAELRRDDEANPKLPKLLCASFLAKRLDCGDSSPLLGRHYVNNRGKAALKPPQSKRFAWKDTAPRFGDDWFASFSLRNSAFSASLRLIFAAK
jgi:hypothetical protein